MVRESDPTSKILLTHYGKHFKNDGGVDALADLIVSLCNLRLPSQRRSADAVDRANAPR